MLTMQARGIIHGSVSFSDLRQLNRGSYDYPQSGVGIEYAPLGAPLTKEEIRIHEVGYLAANDWWNFPNMVSPFWRLYYNSEAGHTVVFEDREIALEPDHMVLIPDHQMFHSHGTTAVPHFWIAFSVGLFLQEDGPRVLQLRADEARLIRSICRNFTGLAQGDRFAIFHESAALLHQVIVRAEIKWDDQPRSEAALKVAAHISRNYAQSIEVPMLARLAGLSPRALSILFQREYHTSPTRFIARVRTGEAAKLLAETDESLEDIARKTGFPNRFYLTRVFNKLTGKAPARFRREHRRDGSA